MPLPSYARATASSIQRTGVASPKSRDGLKDKRRESKSPYTPSKRESFPQRRAESQFSNPKCTSARTKSPQAHTPKTLKRPSTLTAQTRRKQAYNADLHRIKPLDASKPCPLALLPSELRTKIYTYLFCERPLHDLNAYHRSNNASLRPQLPAFYLFPPILHTCRALRIEAAYTFYTSVPFYWRITNLNFSRVKRWLALLPPAHRALLPRNRTLTLDVLPLVSARYTYPPPNYLLDDYIKAHWKACAPFGRLYTVAGKHRQAFIVFCRLAAWWLLPVHSGGSSVIHWVYKFDTNRRMDYALHPTIAGRLLSFLREDVGVVRMRAVQRAWTGSRREGEMGREARRFLDALDVCFREVVEIEGRQRVREEEWDKEFGELRTSIEKW